MHSAADDDVYEFKSDSEDHPTSMLLNPENVRNTSNQNFVSSFETRYGLDEEEADDNDDEGNLIGMFLIFYGILEDFLKLVLVSNKFSIEQ
jgi:hypothetical protein